MANMTPRAKASKKRRLLDQHGPFCCYCREFFPPHKLTFEHLKPRSEGGGNNIENLRMACQKCNFDRHH